MTPMTRAPMPVLLVVLVTALLAPRPAAGHSPTPASGDVWPQNQRIEYRWRAGEVPPSWMQSAIHAAAGDSNESRASRAAVFAYDAAATNWIAYDGTIGCATWAIACTSSSVPDWFTVEFRPHGHVFDWGVLRWCEVYSTPPDGCTEAENIALHEFGHVQSLNHHVLYADQSDYRDSVVQNPPHSKPKVGWNAHAFGRCDVATLQRRYDVLSTTTRYSTCALLDTTLAIAASRSGSTVTFTATLKVTASTSYGRLSGNLISRRLVSLQRRPPGTTTWSTVGTMPAGAAAGTYVLSSAPSATYEWRAIFPKPAAEGLEGAVSSAVSVTVGSCIDEC